MSNRYARQQQVPQLRGDAQTKLEQAHALIVGAGGLGSPVSMQLAGAGVGRVTLIDPDVVSLSNLHRQSLYTEQDIGLAKVVAAKQRLTAINGSIQVDALNQSLHIDNAEDMVKSANVVIDAADSFFVSYLLSDLCLKHRTPLISASVLMTNGYVGVFCGTSEQPAPSMRAIFPAPPATAANCETAGVTGPSVGIIGSLQAQEALKVIVGDPAQLLGKLLYMDLWEYRQNIVDFSSAAEPSRYAPLRAKGSLTSLDCLIDVRTELEVQSSPHSGVAINIPLAELENRYTELPNGQPLVCICKSGQRALVAAHKLAQLGFADLAVTL